MAIKNYIVVGLAVCALAACNTSASNKVAGQVDEDFTNAAQAFDASRAPKDRVGTDTVSASEGVWLGSRSTAIRHRNDLPGKFETGRGITIIMDEPAALSAIANNIFEITGIHVQVDGQVSQEKLSKTISVSHSGKLSDLLTRVATDLDLLWYYDREDIVFYETETRTFNLYALGTDISFSSRIQTDDSNQVSLESNLREWEEIERSLTGILDGVSNAKFTVSRSLGTVTLTASPSVQKRVSEYIARQNRRLAQQVSIDVKVLQVSIQNANAVGLNLTAAIASAGGLSLSSSESNTVAGATNGLNVAVLDGAGALAPAAGSNALVQALARQGKVSLMTNASVTTRNNRVAPVSNVRNTGYIKRIESRTFTAVESSSVEQDVLETGFSMQLLPNILDGGRVLLLFKMSLRELIRMNTETVGGSNGITIQMPDVEERSFMQEVILESGQMLVISGFERQANNDIRYGIGEADFMALGGSRDTSSQRDVLVVILTPQVHVSPMDSERNIMREQGAPLN
ncbi:MAG: hypothetical protein LBH81_00180 [Rickettsiales bacterium]|jgi:type IVB pilus formation R64 PilN family outer membrane protein|nr:hypothetical protein [Rickettsiales bacterium]